ncbi:hypothetical protein [Deinococcus arenicola]|uniref:Uncharacterized protein n=1 Tax=Deinococcus arenicola TaxID=2994950 RepID=A0ABU4DU74_9DEIO|nr:hypothetical protein [Deinococcus sp. ZS9-10]MDV6375532.1 hypothetical protein [Deinococcus sp. ZS9-10]
MAIQRTGLIRKNQVSEVVEAVCATGFWQSDGVVISTMLIKQESAGIDNRLTKVSSISLQDIDIFIQDRMKSFVEKRSDWTYFQDDFLEYVIWQAQQRDR